LEYKTLEDAFKGVKPLVIHFGIFGCPLYIHIPKEKRMNLESPRKEGTFVGYIENSKCITPRVNPKL
jgi:hypothetical protein